MMSEKPIFKLDRGYLHCRGDPLVRGKLEEFLSERWMRVNTFRPNWRHRRLFAVVT
jgi:hypothetical protein